MSLTTHHLSDQFHNYTFFPQIYRTKHLSHDDWLVGLINQIIAHPKDVYLILDDYHLITDTRLHSGLAFLIGNAPPNLHILIATRTEPDLPLPRLRAKSQLLEITASDLRFLQDEAHNFVTSQLDTSISNATLEQLLHNTEGWIAGIHLALLAAKQHNAPNKMLQSVSGTHRYIFDYLMQDVLEQQTEGIRHFLISTAVLGQFSAALCDAVLSQNQSQHMIETLIEANLFIVPVDNDNQWFRYHHLFHEVLVEHTDNMLSAADMTRIHQQAAIWLHQHEYYHQALAHAMRAEDFDLAVQIILDSSVNMFALGYVSELRQWMDALSAGWIDANWRMCMVYAWTLRFVRDVKGVQQYVSRAQSLLREQSLSEDDSNWYLAEQAGLQAFVAYVCGDDDEVLEQYEQVTDYRTDQNDIAYIGMSLTSVRYGAT